MAQLLIKLLGQFELQLSDNTVVPLSAKKSRALLAYLAMQPGRQHAREKLAALLWSDSDSSAARTNLRQCLASIRKSTSIIYSPCIVGDGETISFVDSDCSTDVALFEQLCRDASPASLEEATSLYRGELLDGLSIDEEPINEWILTERRQLNEKYHQALLGVLNHSASTPSLIKSISIANKLLALDPLQESVHRTLLQCYSELGRRGALKQQFDACRDVLMQELGVKPEPATEKLYRKLMSQIPQPENIDRNNKLTCSQSTTDKVDDISTVQRNRKNTDLHAQPAAKIEEESLAIPNSNNTRTAVHITAQPVRSREIDQARPTGLLTSLGIAVAMATLTLAGVLYFLGYIPVGELNGNNKTDTITGAEQIELMAADTTTRPSLAVLPFSNLAINSDDNNLYFSDGLTEDILTDLSRISGLHVTSRISSFAFRDQTLSKQQVATRLGVRYILDGSIRREALRVRINAYLVDTESNENIWADRYDRNLTDILEVQNDVTQKIVAALSIRLTDSEQYRFEQSHKVDPDAYDLLLRGLLPFRTFTRENNLSARRYFEQAIEVAPDYARAHANLALSYGREVVFNYNERNSAAIVSGLEAADQAEVLDESLPQVYFAKAVLHLANSNHKLAVAAARKSIALDPGYADGYTVLAQTLAYSGVLNEALAAIRTAKKLNPLFPFGYQFVEGHIHYQRGRYPEAVPYLQDAAERNPSFYLAHLVLAAAYGQLGREDDASWHVAELLTLHPESSLAAESRNAFYLKRQHLEHLLDGLKKAGLSN